MTDNVTRLSKVAADQIDAELTEIVQREHAPRRRIEREDSHLPLPPYVQHHDEVSDVGRLSAQAIAAQYEQAAQAIIGLSQRLITMAKECDEDTMMVIKHNEMVRGKIDEVVAECMNGAQLYRDEAKAVFEKIQKQSLLVDETRRSVETMCRRIRSGEPLTAEVEIDG